MRYLTFLLLLTGNVLFSKSIEVCEGCEVNSLAVALTKAFPEDTILVHKGTYATADLVIDKPIFLQGEDGAILDGQGKGYVLIVRSDSVSIQGLTLVGAGRSYTKDFAAIYVDRVRHFSIKNISF